MTVMKQENAYERLMSHYDDVMTGRRWWSWLYMHCLWGVDDNEIARKVLDFIPNDFRGKLLDVPVGTGVFTAEKYKNIAQAGIVGLDYSGEMLALAAVRREEEKLNNLNLVQGDVGNLPYPDGFFDCVLSMNGFHVFPDKEKSFAETFRVLKPGGLFCGCYYIKGERAVADFLIRGILERKGFFIPPYDTVEEAQARLRLLYGTHVQVENFRSMFVFKCVKPAIEKI